MEIICAILGVELDLVFYVCVPFLCSDYLLAHTSSDIGVDLVFGKSFGFVLVASCDCNY